MKKNILLYSFLISINFSLIAMRVQEWDVTPQVSKKIQRRGISCQLVSAPVSQSDHKKSKKQEYILINTYDGFPLQQSFPKSKQ